VAAPIQIKVYDKTFAAKGEIGAPKFVTVNLRDISVGFGKATIGVLATDRMIEPLMADGARVWIRRPDGSDSQAHILSGYVTARRATGTTQQALYEFDVTDDASFLDEVSGWVIPANAITNQGAGNAVQWVLEDDAETVLKTAVTANAVTRLGMPITVATNQHRGSDVRGVLRYEPLWTKLFPVVDGCGMSAAGIGVSVRQNGTSGLLLDVYERAVYPRPLTELGGVVTDWSWTQTAATATRVVVGGPGEGYLRSLRTVVDYTREMEIGHVIERWRDARDVTEDQIPDLLYARGQEILDDGATKYGLSVTLAETPAFRYGTNVRVGDTVTVEVAGQQITDVLTEALLSWTRDAGWRVEPRVGEKSDDPDRLLGRYIAKLSRAVNRMQRV